MTVRVPTQAHPPSRVRPAASGHVRPALSAVALSPLPFPPSPSRRRPLADALWQLPSRHRPHANALWPSSSGRHPLAVTLPPSPLSPTSKLSPAQWRFSPSRTNAVHGSTPKTSHNAVAVAPVKGGSMASCKRYTHHRGFDREGAVAPCGSRKPHGR